MQALHIIPKNIVWVFEEVQPKTKKELTIRGILQWPEMVRRETSYPSAFPTHLTPTPPTLSNGALSNISKLHKALFIS